jgi:predicted DNA-binding protein YlxM (UPF0122 family)
LGTIRTIMYKHRMKNKTIYDYIQKTTLIFFHVNFKLKIYNYDFRNSSYN